MKERVTRLASSRPIVLELPGASAQVVTEVPGPGHLQAESVHAHELNASVRVAPRPTELEPLSVDLLLEKQARARGVVKRPKTLAVSAEPTTEPTPIRHRREGHRAAIPAARSFGDRCVVGDRTRAASPPAMAEGP